MGQEFTSQERATDMFVKKDGRWQCVVSQRPVALGRKNWLHIGSPRAGPKVAAILSIVESCRRLQVPVRDYFSSDSPRAR